MSNQNSQIKIQIKNCNNIDFGEITLELNKLNIKYGINGTGKSTISQAIQYAIEDNGSKLKNLLPFKHVGKNDATLQPKVEGLNSIRTIKIFDDNYVNQFVYLPDELVKNSFEIFVQTEEYNTLSVEIEEMIVLISNTFKEDEKIDDVISTFKNFLNGCGKSNSSLAKNGAIHKGLANGNKIDNIPQELSAYQPYLQNKKDALNLKWLQWQTSGHVYLDIAEICPFCTASTTQTRTTIERVAQEFDVKTVDNLIKMLNLFEMLVPFFAEETNKTIKEISFKIDGLSDEHKNYLFAVKQQVQDMHSKLETLKYLNPATLRDIDKISDDIQKKKFDWQFFSHLKSSIMEEKILAINSVLDNILTRAGELQGKINKHKVKIKETIESHQDEINSFLQCAGYKYKIYIEETKEKSFKLKIKHVEFDTPITDVQKHLSYGERNALALVMFMYDTLKEQPDIIVLDDPISSFDGNKQFAIINLLFMREKNFKNRTVLILSHEFNLVIDCIYNMCRKLSVVPTASYLWITNGILKEAHITKNNIQSITNILHENINESINIFCKCVYLRRYLELSKEFTFSYQVLSNLFKKRKELTVMLPPDGERKMTEDEFNDGVNTIRNYISDFNYDELLQVAEDNREIIDIYWNCDNNYEKLHIYRIIITENNKNTIVKKFVNEVYHIENDFLFQLNPRKYDIVPEFIIDECNKDIQKLEEELKETQNP